MSTPTVRRRSDDGAGEENSDRASTPIIDTHQHLWDFSMFRPPWLEGEPSLDVSTTMADYLKATAGLNVRRTVYMEVDVAPEDQLREAEWVESVCASQATPMAAAVVSCRPGSPDFVAYARRVSAMPHVRGFRQVLHSTGTPRGTCLQPDYLRDIRLMASLGMMFDICIRPTELLDAAALADACPEAQFILDHCGNGAARNPDQEQWSRDIADLARRPNVVCKISGIIRTVKPVWDPVTELKPIVLHCLHSFGMDRVMFGGDWPVCNLGSSFAGWVACLQEIVRDLSAREQRQLFHDNAESLYRLPQA